MFWKKFRKLRDPWVSKGIKAIKANAENVVPLVMMEHPDLLVNKVSKVSPEKKETPERKETRATQEMWVPKESKVSKEIRETKANVVKKVSKETKEILDFVAKKVIAALMEPRETWAHKDPWVSKETKAKPEHKDLVENAVKKVNKAYPELLDAMARMEQRERGENPEHQHRTTEKNSNKH